MGTRGVTGAVAALLIALGVPLYAGADADPSAPAGAHPSPAAAGAEGSTAPDALALLDGLTVAEPDRSAPVYERAGFGPGWVDADGDGCDTRAEVLQRDLDRERLRTPPAGSCLVLSGVFIDPASGITGEAVARYLDVDHRVSLADAWRSGAWRWSGVRRVAFANDEGNLEATTDTWNRVKGDDGPGDPDPGDDRVEGVANLRLPDGSPLLTDRNRCGYAVGYVTAKARWGLSMTATDEAALRRLLEGCAR